MTRKATWLTTSGITGLTLPGMIEEPAWTGGRRISARPVRGPAREQAAGRCRSWTAWTANPFQQAGEEHEGAHVGGRLDQVGGQYHRVPGQPRQFLDGQCRIARVGVDAGADGGRPEIDLAEQGRDFAEPRHILLDGHREGVELLAERHRHGVLELRAAHLDNVGEVDRLGAERIGQVVERMGQRRPWPG